jgi:HTH-type transcriptional regulator/antitoxin HigA
MMNATEYEHALQALDRILDAPEGSEAAKTRERLVDEIERYEDLHYPIDLPDLKGAIIARLDDLNLTPNDSVFTGTERQTIRDIIAGTTEPSDHAVRVLLEKLGIPPEVMDGEGR